MEVIIPDRFEPRPYQLEFLKQLYSHRRAVQVWHRRAGKDLVDFIYTISQAFNRVGNYWHVFPEYNQGRKAIWNAKTKEGRSYLSYIPKEAIKRRRDQEMYLEFINGSSWQVVGGDNVDSIVGAGPAGVVLSEWSLQRPGTWHYIEPMLLENDGWALFNMTPRGDNHAKQLWDMACNNPEWLTSMLTVEDTGSITKEQIDKIRAEGRSEDLIQQEYYCSFKSPIQGAYYADIIRELEADGRIGVVPYATNLPVKTFWDVGFTDYVSIWFAQKVGLEYRIIDFYQNNGKTMDFYVKVLRDKGYNYLQHVLPHDANHHKTIAIRETEADILQKLMPGVDVTVQKVTRSEQQDIQIARMFMKRCRFDKVNTSEGLEALKNFTKAWNDATQTFSDKPRNDWTCHASDSWRYLAIHCAVSQDVAEDFDYDNLEEERTVKVQTGFSLNDYL